MEVGSEYAVQMHGIVKTFGSFCALDHVDLDVKKGTVHALLGENGAGKSTLMNILYGLYQADSGNIYVNGTEVNIKDPNVAIRHGIGMVHQHFMLIENFTVLQNVILGSEVTNKFGVLNMAQAREKVQKIVEEYGFSVDLDAKIEDITVGMQQRVEILKALYRGVDILILDEPTAVLTPQEIGELLDIMKNLVKSGKTIILITHKLKEIQQSSDVCTIIRRGKLIDTVKPQEVDEETLAQKMVGHPVKLVVEKTPAQPKEAVFEVDGLSVRDKRGVEAVKNLSLKIHSGEIYGIAGVDGNGQKELVDAIMSLAKAESGTIKINGQEIQNTTPFNVISHKVSTIPEDRQRCGLVLNYSCQKNMILENYHKSPFSEHGILQNGKILEYTKQLVQDYDIRPADCEALPVRSLSGGNQQKLIIAREISNEPDLLIAVQPTRGLDVGAIEYVHKMLIHERDEGKAVLLISLELDEVLSVADTIGVIYDGAITGTFAQGDADEKMIGLLMAGGKQNAVNS
jgi:simple sugar transport system ATP-binding protein